MVWGFQISNFYQPEGSLIVLFQLLFIIIMDSPPVITLHTHQCKKDNSGRMFKANKLGLQVFFFFYIGALEFVIQLKDFTSELLEATPIEVEYITHWSGTYHK